MPKGDVETYYGNGQWHSRIEGEDQPFASGNSKSEQVSRGAAQAWSRRVQHIIRREDGQIASRQNYRDDEPDR